MREFPRRSTNRRNAGSPDLREVQVAPAQRARVGRVDRARCVREAREETGSHGWERKLLTRSKQVADLVAVYGKRAVYANSGYGVGPTTASKILAKMQDTEKEVLNHLFEAKLKDGPNRPYLNEPQAKPRLY